MTNNTSGINTEIKVNGQKLETVTSFNYLASVITDDGSKKYSCHIHLHVCLWIMDPHSWVPKKNRSHGNEMLSQDTAHLIQRPFFLTRKTVPRSSRQSDYMKTSWLLQRDANCSGMVMFPVPQVWPKPSCKVQWKGEEDKADRRRGGKTTSGNGQAWNSPSPRGQWRTGKDGGNCLRNHLWCPNYLLG